MLALLILNYKKISCNLPVRYGMHDFRKMETAKSKCVYRFLILGVA